MRISGDEFNSINYSSIIFRPGMARSVVIWDDEYNLKPSEFSNTDEFICTESVNLLDKVTPQGCNDPKVLAQAPSPDITVQGVKQKAGIVVDISTNILYRYDKDGNPIMAYQIGSGKKSTGRKRRGSRYSVFRKTTGPRRHIRRLERNDGTLQEN